MFRRSSLIPTKNAKIYDLNLDESCCLKGSEELRTQQQDLEDENFIFKAPPRYASIDEAKTSVLASFGATLIGLKVAQTIKWLRPQGKEKEI